MRLTGIDIIEERSDRFLSEYIQYFVFNEAVEDMFKIDISRKVIVPPGYE